MCCFAHFFDANFAGEALTILFAARVKDLIFSPR